MRVKFLIALFFLIPFQARAEWTQEQCPEVDFSDKMGPVRNQASVEQCYAFVAADLIGFNQGLGPDQRVSALDVTTNYLTLDPDELLRAPGKRDPARFTMDVVASRLFQFNRESEKEKSILEKLSTGGHPPYAIEAYNFRGGLCTEKQLPSEGRWAFEEGRFFFQAQIARLLGKSIVFDPPSFPAGIYSPSPLVGRPRDEPRLSSLCVPPDSLHKLLAFRTEMRDQSLRSLNEAVNKACTPRKPLKPMTTFREFFERGKESGGGQFIANVLRQGQPVGIIYDSSFLKGSAAPASQLSHASSVVGSRWNSMTRQCEFKIRNSWGFSCDVYHEQYRSSCDGGNIWVKADDLSRRMDFGYGINPQPPAK